MSIRTYAVNCNDAWLNTEGDDISGSYVKYKDHQEVVTALEAKCAALAAESAATNDRLQRLIQIINNADNSYCMCGEAMETHAHGGCGHPTGMFDYHYDRWLESEKETTDTDAFLAEVRAQGVEMLIKYCEKKALEKSYDFFMDAGAVASQFAAQLRQDANTAELVAAGIITKVGE